MLNKINLSVIIPLREISKGGYYLSRLSDLCTDFESHQNIEIIVVDSGSSIEWRDECLKICQKNNIRYLYHNSENQLFSIGAARDFGVQYANGDAVTFLDVDLRFTPDFWKRLLHLINVVGIPKKKKNFFVIPCMYLTEEGTHKFYEMDKDTRFLQLLHDYLTGDKENIQNFAPCTSVMVVNRFHYLSVGGHHPEFRGHGYEDFELYHRLMIEEGALPRADSYYKDMKNWNTFTFNGFRSQLSLLGRTAQMYGLFVVHLWHPRPKSNNFYRHSSENREIWVDLFKDFDRTGNHPLPLVDANVKDKNFLVFGKPNTNAMRCLRDIMPHLGNPIYVNEYDFIDHELVLEEDLEELISHRKISFMLFPNPYGNMTRLKIYHWCKKVGLKYLVYERGALPDSWFFDPSGFNADSESYSKEKWDRPLSGNDKQKVRSYIQKCLKEMDTLETQGRRLGPEALAHKLRIGGKKVLFVPLQRPSDTVIKFMSGPLGSHRKFLELVDKVALKLKSKGWVVVCKKHPLEVESPPMKHAIYSPEDTHFLDLLEMADAVGLINSGVGVYAMMLQKPCFIFGEAFYSVDGVNQKMEDYDPEKIAYHIQTPTKVNMETVFRFVYYLINNFYSFGKATTKKRVEADGSIRTLTTSIDFYQIRLPDRPIINYELPHLKLIYKSAPLLERFQLDIIQKQKFKLPINNKEIKQVVNQNKNKKLSKIKIGMLVNKPLAFFFRKFNTRFN